MKFEKLFEGRSWPEAKERIGVMSVDSLNRRWVLVSGGRGYLIAKSSDGRTALLGRMCKRDDGKFCIEIVVRAEIENNELRHYEAWHIGSPEAPGRVRWFGAEMQIHLRR
jgi:hypothetical protein